VSNCGAQVLCEGRDERDPGLSRAPGPGSHSGIYLIRAAIVPPWFVKIRVPSGRWISVTNWLV
jgi:hypothetical protein